MMKTLVALLLPVILVACKNEAPAPAAKAPAPATAAAPAPARESPKPAPDVARPAAEAAAPAAAAAPAFSVDNVAMSSATLGAFPYFSLPDGVTEGDVKGQVFDFERRNLQAGKAVSRSRARCTSARSRWHNPKDLHRT
jgi:hypothetical protein